MELFLEKKLFLQIEKSEKSGISIDKHTFFK